MEVPGYIGVYRSRLRRLDEDEKERLDKCLEELLDLCQCLPDSSRTESGGWIWRVERKKIVVITNPGFYRIKKIGKRPSTRKDRKVSRSAPAQRGIKSATVAMMVVQGEIPRDIAERAYRYALTQKERLGRKSARARNARKPPGSQRKRVEARSESTGQKRKRNSHLESDSDSEARQSHRKKRRGEKETESENEDEEEEEDNNSKSEDADMDRWDRGSDADNEDEDQWARSTDEDEI